MHKNTVNPDAVFSHYAAYTVTVALDGRQRMYQAIFLFGRNPDGSENVYPIDHILGMGVLNMVTDRSLYPQPLLETYMRELPAINQWISSAGVNSDSTNQELICDPVTGGCGIPAKALKKSLEVPVDPETRKFYQSFQSDAKRKAKPDSAKPGASGVAPSTASCSNYNFATNNTLSAFGTTDHFGPTAGNDHIVNQSFLSECFYTSGGTQNCATECVVDSTSTISTHVDQGKTVTGYCHVVGLNAGNGASNATNAGTSCTGTMYGGADECPTSACDCTVTVSALGVVTGTGKNIWLQSTPLPLTCSAVSDPTYCSGSGSNYPCTGGGGGGGCQPPDGGCPDGEAWNSEECTCTSGQSSPIVVDTTGRVLA